jgi:serine phosphatase RsbU (regulator of sigma subunit)
LQLAQRLRILTAQLYQRAVSMAGVEPAGKTLFATQAAIADSLALGDDLRSYLVVIENDQAVGYYPLGLEPLTVGRDPSRSIVLADAQVSRLHLQIFDVGGQMMVEDLGSSNGTYLDGKRLSGPVALGEGKWLQVGSRRLKHERRGRREVERAEELRRDLDKARSYVRSLLPAPITSGPIRTDWLYQPSTQLGGDAFSYDRLDDTHVMVYLIDVSGHGVGAAMHSVAVLNVLRQRALPGADFHDPAQVLDRLNAMFPMEDHDGMYFTIWYGVYSLTERQLAYASAGHHAALLFAPGAARAPLRTVGPMIGALPGYRYVAGTTAVPAEAALYLFSDGVFEITTPEGAQCGLDDFLPLLEGSAAQAAGEAERLYRAVCTRAKPGPLDDDFSLLVVRFH